MSGVVIETIEQFKVLTFIEEQFDMESVRLDLVDERSIKVTDKKGDTVVFAHEDGYVMIVE